jgi:hypothetical protein
MITGERAVNGPDADESELDNTKRPPTVQYRISALLALNYLVALLFVKDAGLILFLLLINPLVIWIVVCVLDFGVPKYLRDLSHENTYRLDGSQSESRRQEEVSAAKALRLDLYLSVSYVALSFDFVVVLNEFVLRKTLSPDASGIVEIVLLAFWFCLAFFGMRIAYMHALQEYFESIQMRKTDYIDKDLEAKTKNRKRNLIET